MFGTKSLAVLVILGILATIVVVNVSPVFQRANLEKIKADMAQTSKALELYKFNELTYPSTSQGLDALVMPHNELNNPFLYPEGGYISSIPSDPWGREYIYEYPRLVICKEDLIKRKRIKNSIPCLNRCSAKRADGDQCTRRRKDGCDFCGTHAKGTPHGLISNQLFE